MNLQKLVLNVRDYTQQRLSQYIEELKELCFIDSFSYHKPGLDEAAIYLAARMRGIGIEATIVEREACGNDLLGVLHGEGKSKILLLGHTDTVYPVGTASARRLRLEGDTVYGPGVSDMKGCLLSAIYALEALHTMDYRSFGEIRFLCVSDEEIDDRHSLDLIQQACENCDVALVLEAARANGDIVSARKGGGRYILKAYGRAAHAGVEPENGRNAIEELAHQILQFQSLNHWREGITVNAGVLSGGTVVNVVPDFAQARFDLRFLTLQDRNDTEQKWRELMQKQRVPGVELTLEMAPVFRTPMVRTPENLKLASTATDIANALGFSLNNAITGGGSDASYTSSYGIPTLDGLGPIGGHDHSPDEYLLLSSVAPRTALLAGLIASMDM